MLSNKEILELLGMKLNMEIIYRGRQSHVEGCLFPKENKLETYIFYSHGIETKSKLAHESVFIHYPIYSKKRHMFVNRTINKFSKIIERTKKKGVCESSDFNELNNLPAKVDYTSLSRNGKIYLDLQKGSPIWNSKGQLKFNFVNCYLTSYSDINYKEYNKGANELNKVGIRTTSSIYGQFH